MIHLTTQRLRIREPEAADFPEHHRLLSDPAVMRYLPDIHTHSPEESRDNLEFAMAASARTPRKYVFLCMERLENGAFIGQIGYTVDHFTPVGALAGVGYFLLREHWGKGYAAEALRELLRYAFEEGGVARISCGCTKENVASERVMQKCGLIKEAEHRRFTWHEGQLKDRVVYRLLREEWAGG